MFTNTRQTTFPTLFELSIEAIINSDLVELTRYVKELESTDTETTPDYANLEKCLLRVCKFKFDDLVMDTKDRDTTAFYNQNKFKYKELSIILFHLFKHKKEMLLALQEPYAYHDDIINKYIPEYTFSEEFLQLITRIYAERNEKLKKIADQCKNFNFDYKSIEKKCNATGEIYIDDNEIIQQEILHVFDETITNITLKQFGRFFDVCWIYQYEKVLLKMIHDKNAFIKFTEMLNSEDYDIISFFRIMTSTIEDIEIANTIISEIFAAIKKRFPHRYFGYLMGAHTIGGELDPFHKPTAEYFCILLKLVIQHVFLRSKINLTDQSHSVFDITLYEAKDLQDPDDIERPIDEKYLKASLGDHLVITYLNHLIYNPTDNTLINYIKTLLVTEKSKQDFLFDVHVKLKIMQLDNQDRPERALKIRKKVISDTSSFGKLDQDEIDDEVSRIYKPRPKDECIIS